MRKIAVIFGTRPEAIKLAPLIKQLISDGSFEVTVISSGQHKQLLNPVIEFFGISVDYDLDVMEPNQQISITASKILVGLSDLFEKKNFDYVIVHGDTTTTISAALAAFYAGCKVLHVEAGLRTNDIRSPFPEEANRRVSSCLTEIHFAATEKNSLNLQKEGVNKNNIYVTGNTVIDALFYTRNTLVNSMSFLKDFENRNKGIDLEKKFILVTSHRRENFGLGIQHICDALKEIARRNPNINIIYPIHLNPNIYEVVRYELKDQKNIQLLGPLAYPDFVYLMSKCFIIMTDSGGLQEEGPSLDKPVIVLRETTERIEGLEAGTIILTGTETKSIVDKVQQLINNPDYYVEIAGKINPYGDGTASAQIVNIIREI